MPVLKAPAFVLVVCTLLGLPQVAAARPGVVLIPPVDGPIVRHFDPPQGAYGPGHRGIDYAVEVGTPVRAAAAGVVTFAGPVAGLRAVTVQHAGALKSTYSSLGAVLVRRGQEVEPGTIVGRALSPHPDAEPGLHFGVKLNERYVDPEAYLGAVDVADAIHLAPLGEPSRRDDLARPCRPVAPVARAQRPPNDNIAVAVAGIGSRTKNGLSAEIYEAGPDLLGYPLADVYWYSYAGPNGRHLHRPYGPTATFGDIRKAAARLGDLLRRIHRRHPHRDVDLIAHSQGGIVARYYLESRARPWARSMPRVDHLVTFASPHSGAPLAALVPELARTDTGLSLLAHLSRAARLGSPIPDPLSRAVAQLAPGSLLLRRLARRDVVFGTRVLALGMPTDLVVPADSARYPDKESRTLPPVMGWAHDAIVHDAAARGLAYAFLRDAPLDCPGGWDRYGPAVGSGISWFESKGGALYRGAERTADALRFLGRLGATVSQPGKAVLAGARLGVRGLMAGLRGVIRAEGWVGGRVVDAARWTGGRAAAGASALWRGAGAAAGWVGSGLTHLWP